MTPVFQTIFDADGGNCLSATIASILELPIDDVPDFARDHGDDCGRAAKDWLYARGLRVIEIGFAHWQTFCDTCFENVGDYCILSGPSSYPDRAHAVVGRIADTGGVGMVHDPTPGGFGPLRGWRRVQFIVPCDT